MASGQLGRVIGRMVNDAMFRQAERNELHKVLATGGHTLTDEETATLIEADAPEIAIDRRGTEGTMLPN